MIENLWQYTPIADDVPPDYQLTCPRCGCTHFRAIGLELVCSVCLHAGGEWMPPTTDIEDPVEIPDIDIESLL